ncbi:serine hydrolase domain-containing protein [Jiella mangrovi]|uniref:Serine hydrolase n=1 Tax=Jiella mangrovi TaxID=2821407 RepID=A0ABS4BIS5_9HYPH|nr:serine hydrolase [Jiella mangrovi]MBP0616591.1 serine hydrolase [Jiella mangrovi]
MTKKALRRIALLAAATLGAATAIAAVPSFAQTPIPRQAPERSSNAPDGPANPQASFDAAVARAEALEPLQTLLVAVDGERVVDEGFGGHRTDRATNIKSASKSIVSALVGIAIDRGILEGTDQKIAPILKDKLPTDPDPRLAEITIGNLLSMQAGLERTSGGNYGGWVASRDWVANALARPFVADPGGPMLYSTGSTHLLSAILTRASGRSTLQLARDWLGPAGVSITAWERDPQGIYLGGNQMAMTPRSLLNFGALYRNGGRTAKGEPIIPEAWIRQSWEPRTASRYSGDLYGYGWFELRLAGHDVHYGWGYGGQMLYVIPDLKTTVVITSDATSPSARSGYKSDLHALVADEIIPAAEARQAAGG